MKTAETLVGRKNDIAIHKGRLYVNIVWKKFYRNPVQTAIVFEVRGFIFYYNAHGHLHNYGWKFHFAWALSSNHMTKVAGLLSAWKTKLVLVDDKFQQLSWNWIFSTSKSTISTLENALSHSPAFNKYGNDDQGDHAVWGSTLSAPTWNTSSWNI